MKPLKPAYIDLYVSYGHAPSGITIRGRVLEGTRPTLGTAATTWLGRLRTTWKLAETDELPDVEVRVELLPSSGPPRELIVRTDKEGFFRARFEGSVNAESVRSRATLRSERFVTEPVEAPALIHPETAGIAVISDIDDTVLLSNVKNRFALLKRVLFATPEDLETFKGAAALYQRLVGAGAPLVFVSSSPWNLEPRLRAFLQLRGFPVAPMLLKDLGIGPEADPVKDHLGYKTRMVTEVLGNLPARRFLLIGDSGERDPEIYGGIARAHPERVAAILIHRVTQEPKDSPRFEGMFVFDRYDDAAVELERRGLLAAIRAQPAT
ncbi:MAG TPA: phosphatase domain-containing protein [Myxococcaceae bacterium]|nr:phosphatase domain-containing protein [Myxococcaceae bacterium]